jgi:hypothetical protein
MIKQFFLYFDWNSYIFIKMISKNFLINSIFALSIFTSSIWVQTYFDQKQFEIIDQEYILQA